MILGLGIDAVDVARIGRAMQNPSFVHRILTDQERLGCRTPESVAGRWAAKEAIAKALGFPLSWQDVEISNDDKGRPVASAPIEPGQKLLISITHEKSVAVAVAILEG